MTKSRIKSGYRNKAPVFSLIILGLLVIIRLIGSKGIIDRNFNEEDLLEIEYLVIEQSYQNGTKYINQAHGIYVISEEPHLFDVGDKIKAVGKPELRVIMGKVTRVYLYNPSIVVVSADKVSFSDRLRISLIRFRSKMVSSLEKKLPEPHASLATGMLLGVRASMPQGFYDDLVETGTLHTIAASGYNVSMVLRVVMGVLMIFLLRKYAILIGFVAVIAYVLISGGSPAVVRAGLMGIITYSAYFWGRHAESKRLLWVVAYLMILFDPFLIFDAGFQLSVSATSGILYFEPVISDYFKEKVFKQSKGVIARYLGENLYPTLAATLVTAPIIYYHFGRVSWVSPVANMMVLPLVPSIMFFAFVVVLVGWIPIIGSVASWVLYVPLEIFVILVSFFSN